MSAPKQTGNFIDRRAGASGSDGLEELIGEHRSPFRDPPRERNGSGKGSTSPLKDGACADSSFRGRSGLPYHRASPVRRDTGPPSRRVFVFLGLFPSKSGANRAARRRLSSPIRVNAARDEDRPLDFRHRNDLASSYSATRSSCLPSLRPSNSRRSVAGAFSRPHCTSTRYLILPACTQPASAPIASAARGM